MKKQRLTKAELQEMVRSYKSDQRMLEFELERVNAALTTLEKMTPLKEKASKTRGPKKKRGRPRKEESAKTTGPKKRGRKPGKKAAAKKSPVKKTTGTAPKGKRGRPRKNENTVKVVPAKKKTTGKKKAVVKKSSKGLKKVAVKKNEKKIGVKKSRPARKEPNSGAWGQFILNALKTSKKALIKSDLFLLARTSTDGIAKNLDDNKINQQLAVALNKLVSSGQEVVKTYHLGRGNAFALKEWIDNKGDLLPEFQR